MKPAEIATGADGTVAANYGFHKKTPLWYYVLKEAEHYHKGLRLGPMGSTLVAETFIGLVHGDHDSFLWRQSNWKPELPGASPATSPWPTSSASSGTSTRSAKRQRSVGLEDAGTGRVGAAATAADTAGTGQAGCFRTAGNAGPEGGMTQ